MADGIFYKNAILITQLKEFEDFENKSLTIDFPVTIYGLNVIKDGIDITDYIGNPQILSKGYSAGDEVLAKVDYSVKDENIVNNITNILKGDITDNIIYKKHYQIKNEDKYAYIDNEGKEVKYNGPDKDKNAKFTEWID